MTNLKNIKRALFSSIVALMLCFAMLLGTTFAWFTDTVTSSGNKIVAGTLDVELILHTADGDFNISEDSRPIFGPGSIAQNNASATLWEPGKTQTVYLSIKNNGSLNLKYKVALEVTGITKNLNEAMKYIITPDATLSAPVAKADLDWTAGLSVVSGNNVAVEDVELMAGAEHFFALSVHMDEEAGNEYQNGSITFDLKVLAGQLASEYDSFDNQYDALATYPASNFAPIPSNDQFPLAGLDVDILSEATGKKVGSMNFPMDALDSNATEAGGKIVEAVPYGNFSVQAGNEMLYFDITAAGLKSDNDVPVVVRVYIGEGLDPDTFKAYHYETEMADDFVDPDTGETYRGYNYNPYTGYLTFATATFSPFAVEYDKESVFVPSTATPADLPVANVVRSGEYENTDLEWGSYGSWSPTEGLSSHLEAAYTFSCVDTLEEAKASPYAEWYCDFVVVLDQDLAANQLFLGGNYGSFGWVGFHNGDLELEANTEVPLLGSVTSNPWSYVDVVQNVGTFICGVGDVDNALAGATFKVMLRLTNPENESEFYNVSTIEFTFGN